MDTARAVVSAETYPVVQAMERARAMEAVAKEAKHIQFKGGNTEADEAHALGETLYSSPNCWCTLR